MPKPRTSPQAHRQHQRSASRYKRSETSRLLKGALDAGLQITGLEVDPVSGALRVLVGKSDDISSRSQDAGDAK